MPAYEYFCEACERKFVVSLQQDEQAKIVCPKCGCDKVHQVAAAYAAISAKKS